VAQSSGYVTGEPTRRSSAYHASTLLRPPREPWLPSPAPEFSPRAGEKHAAGTGARHHVTGGAPALCLSRKDGGACGGAPLRMMTWRSGAMGALGAVPQTPPPLCAALLGAVRARRGHSSGRRRRRGRLLEQLQQALSASARQLSRGQPSWWDTGVGLHRGGVSACGASGSAIARTTAVMLWTCAALCMGGPSSQTSPAHPSWALRRAETTLGTRRRGH
jgi:hypothetical protein